MEISWGSIADWVTALVAAPAAALFLWDRRKAERERLTVRASTGEGVLRLTIRYRPGSPDRGIAVRLKAIDPPDMTFGNITYDAKGPTMRSDFAARMVPDRGDDSVLHCRVTTSSPSSSAIVKVSLIKVPGKTSFTSRRMKISALS